MSARQARIVLLATALCAAGCDTGPAERTLDNCGTTTGGGVPELFRRFFRCVDASADGQYVTLATEDLPPHRSYYYGAQSPNYEPFDTSRGAQYHPNPNLLSSKQIRVEVPVAPVDRGLTISAGMVDGVVGTSASEYPLGPVGVALDGVALFNPMAAPGADIEQEKYTFDRYNAHPTGTGYYHYHAVSPGPLEVLQAVAPSTAELYGVMCDGTVVMGCQELDGGAVQGALDAQGGHVHDVTGAGGELFLAARYHVHICEGGSRKYTPEIQYYGECRVSG
ncbi:MAG TPA: YHYH protein [Myxococcales bacterium]|nr:YHYH protein [Myxococcales bacterium]